MHVPLLFSFWFTVAAYVVHCIDESLLGSSFVQKVRQHWWPELETLDRCWSMERWDLYGRRAGIYDECFDSLFRMEKLGKWTSLPTRNVFAILNSRCLLSDARVPMKISILLN